MVQEVWSRASHHSPSSCHAHFQILCWGVRDMKRYQLLQVTSPLVEMECGGTVVRSEHIKNTKENPNFPKPVISFDVVSVQFPAAAVAVVWLPWLLSVLCLRRVTTRSLWDICKGPLWYVD